MPTCFVTIEGLVKVYPMRNKGDAYDALNNLCVRVELHVTNVTDNARKDTHLDRIRLNWRSET